MRDQPLYVTRPAVNPLAVRERRTPALPLLKLSQAIGLGLTLLALFAFHGFDFAGLRATLFYGLLLAYPVLMLCDTKNGAVRLETLLRASFFFGRLLVRRPERAVAPTETEAVKTETTTQIVWYDSDRAIYL